MTEELPVLVELETCHHSLTFTVAPPMRGDEIWCVRCSHMRKVARTSEDLYRIRCRRCTYGRTLGNARLTAERYAAKHSNKKQHPVAVYVGKKLIYVVGSHYALESATLFGQDAPF